MLRLRLQEFGDLASDGRPRKGWTAGLNNRMPGAFPKSTARRWRTACCGGLDRMLVQRIFGATHMSRVEVQHRADDELSSAIAQAAHIAGPPPFTYSE